MLIPQSAIQIGHEGNTPDRENSFSGKVLRIIHYPGRFELTVYIGIFLKINITETHPLAGRLNEGDEIHVSLDADQITFLESR